MKKNILLLFLVLLVAASLSAQVPNPSVADSTEIPEMDNEMQMFIENLVEDADAQEFDFDTEFERLEVYRRKPLDINKAEREELTAFGLLSAIQVQAVLNYKKRTGQIFSYYELLNVPTFDKGTILKILPYITLEATKAAEEFSWSRAFKYGKHVTFSRYQRILETQRGFTSRNGNPPVYPGSPDKLYFRYRFSYRDKLSIGLTMEKDAGEQWFVPFQNNSKLRLPDYFSAHFYVRDLNKNIKAIAIGDYQVFMGQGLMMWSGFGLRKGPNVMNVKRAANTLRPYTSVNEALFLRGAAATFAAGKWESTVFASHRFRDASIAQADTLDDEGSLEALVVSSLQESGLHRTASELRNKHSIQQITTGATARYKGETWQIGANMVYNYLNKPLERQGQLYQKYLFDGQQLLNFGLDYSLWYRNVQFFGETAMSQNGGIATLNGFSAALDERVSMTLVQRYYARNYQHLWGNSFGESANTNNESGVYLGINASLGKGLTLSGYADFFKFPWLRFNVDAPSQGHEYLLRLDYNPSYRWGAYLQYRLEDKEGNRTANETPIDYLIMKRRQNARIHFRYSINNEFELRTRAELSLYTDHEFNRGFMMYQDLVWSPSFAPIRAQVRLAIFDTGNYDTRIYAYENDVLYAFSVPAYYGRGTRFYINLSYHLNRTFSFWFRYAATFFDDRNVIGSGNDLIEGNRRSEVKFQVRMRF